MTEHQVTRARGHELERGRPVTPHPPELEMTRGSLVRAPSSLSGCDLSCR